MSDLPFQNTRSKGNIKSINYANYGCSYKLNCLNKEQNGIKDKLDNLSYKPNQNNNNFLQLLIQKYANKHAGKEVLPLSINDDNQNSQSDESGNESDNDSDYEMSQEEIDNLHKVYYNPEEKLYLKHLSESNKLKIKDIEHKIRDAKINKIPFRFQIIESSLDIETKKNLLEKHDQYISLDERDGEYHKLGEWISNIEKIPFGKYTKLSKNNHSSLLEYCKKSLDDAVYGHESSKLEILKILGNMISNTNNKGNIIALEGPMGNGKTSLIKRGLSKGLNRPFYFIGLGGMTDSNFLNGFSYTYEGAQPGLLIKSLQHTGVMNPIIYFDELDKVSDTPKGAEIYNLLCHITDPSQNMEYQDRYLSDIKIDLSQVIFVFSFNDRTKINPILLDRLKIIETKGYSIKDKCNITNQYLLKEVCNNIGFDSSRIKLTDKLISYIIENYTNEEGVRSLKKILENIISIINLNLLLDTKSKILEILPLTVKKTNNLIEITQDMIDSISSKSSKSDNIPFMYI